MHQLSQKKIFLSLLFLILITVGITAAYQLAQSPKTTQSSAAEFPSSVGSPAEEAGRLPTGKPKTNDAKKGDYNADGEVNSADLPLFMRKFKAGDPSADLDENGIVNSIDLSLFRQLAGI